MTRRPDGQNQNTSKPTFAGTARKEHEEEEKKQYPDIVHHTEMLSVRARGQQRELRSSHPDEGREMSDIKPKAASQEPLLFSTEPSTSAAPYSPTNSFHVVEPTFPTTITSLSIFPKTSAAEIQAIWEYATNVMPECAERTLVRLLVYYTSEERLRKANKIGAASASNTLELNIEDELALLDEQVKKEGHTNLTYSLPALNVKLANKKPKTVVQEIQAMLRKIRPLDINAVINKVQAAAGEVAAMAGQDVILALGVTGSGKSTTLLSLAGVELENTSVEGISHIGPKGRVPPELAKIVSSPSSDSVTQSITTVRLSNSRKLLGDTPGFGDTGGPEIDLAHAGVMLNGAQSAKSVTPLITISLLGLGDRMQELSKFLHTIATFILNLEVHAPSFFYVFSKFDPRAAADLVQRLTDLRKSLKQGHGDGTVILFLKDMITKLESQCGAMIINPLENNAAILEQIINFPVIKNPKQAFANFASPDTMKALNEQLVQQAKGIRYALDSNNMSLLNFRLHQLRRLQSHLKLAVVDEAVENNITDVANVLKEREQEFSRLLAEGSTATHFETASKLMGQIMQFNIIRREHLISRGHFEREMPREVCLQQEKLLNEIKSVDLFSTSDLAKMLKKMRLISKYFSDVIPEIRGLFDEAIVYLNEGISLCKRRAIHSINENQLEACILGMDCLTFAAKHFQEFCVNDVNDQIGEVKGSLFSRFTQDLQKVQRLFSQEMSEGAVLEIANIFTFVAAAQYSSQLDEYISKNKLSVVLEPFNESCIEYFEVMEKTISGMCQVTPINFEDIFVLLNRFKNLNRNNAIRNLGLEIYHRILNQLKDVIHNIQLQANTSFDLFCSQQNNEDASQYLRKLTQLFSYLNQAKPFFAQDPSLDIQEKIQTYLTQAKQQVSTLTDFDQLVQANNLIRRIELLKNSCAEIVNLDEDYLEIQALFHHAINSQLQHLQQVFNLNFNAETMISPKQFTPWLNALNYLRACASIEGDAIKTKKVALEDQVGQFIAFYFENIDKSLREAFEEIKLTLTGEDLLGGRALAPQSRIKLILKHLLGLQHAYDQSLSSHDIDSALHSQLFSQNPQALLESWVQKSDSVLLQFYVELDEQFKGSNIESGNDEREKIIRVTHMLSELDEFLTDPSKRFSDLEFRFRTDMLKFNSEAMNAAREQVEGKRYAEAKDSLTSLKLDANNHLTNKAIQTLVTTYLYDQVASLRARACSLDVSKESVRLLMTDFHILRGAREHLMSFVRVVEGFEDRFVANLEDVLTEIQGQINRFIQGIGALIEESQFGQVEQIIKDMSVMSTLFNGTFYQNKLTLTKRAIEAGIQKQLTKALAFYQKVFGSSLELEEDSTSELPFDITRLHALKPIEFLAKLEQGAVVANRAMYTRTLESLNRMLIVNINRLLNYLIKTAAPEIATAQLSLIETQVKTWLPSNIYKEFAHLIEGCRSSIDDRNRAHEEHSRQLRDENDIAGWLGDMQYNGERKYYHYVLDAVGAIDYKLETDMAHFSSILRSSDPRRILQLLTQTPKLQDEWVKWLDYGLSLNAYVGIDEPVSNIAERAKFYSKLFVERKFNPFKTLLLEEFKRILNEINTLSLQRLTVENAVVYVETIRAFLTLKTTHYSMYSELTAELNEPLEDALRHLVGFLVKNQRQLTDAIQGKNFTLLQECMDAAEEMDSLHNAVNRLINSTLCDSIPELRENVADSRHYHEKKEQFAAAVQGWRDFLLQEFLGDEQRDTFNEDDQNNFYQELFAAYEMMRELSVLQRYLPGHVNINQIVADVDISLERQLEKIKQRLVELLETMPNVIIETYQSFGVVYSHLRACADYFADDRISRIANTMKQDISGIMEGKIHAIEAQAQALQNAEPEQVLKFLLALQSMATHIPPFRQKLEDCIDRILQYYDINTIHIMSPLAAKVFAGEDHASQMLRQRPYFAAFRVADRNQRTQGCGIGDVLGNLTGVKINHGKLHEKFDLFMREYTNLYEDAIRTPAKKREIIENARLILSGSASIHEKILSLITHVFASWTLQSTEYYEKDKNRDFLMQPHPAQLVAIFRAFGLDQEEPTNMASKSAIEQLLAVLKNNLSEVKTGEGKSVILMVIAMVLGMFGVHADCACYSADLSERDFNDAKQLVRDYGLEEFVHYGTLEALSEQYINRNGNVRDQVRDLINGENRAVEVNADETPRVLLLDEFDTLLKAGFLGSAYAPVTVLQGPEIKELILLIWSYRERDAYLKPSFLKTTPEYRACCQKYANWTKLIDAAIKNMSDAVKKVVQDTRAGVKPDYLINDKGEIIYLSEHGVSSTATYGYETMFAYLQESTAEPRLVSLTAMEAHLGVYVNAGLLSYAEIPRISYVRSLGVTATLRQLTEAQRQVLHDYNIDHMTYIPSAYGQSKLIFRPNEPLDVQVAANQAEHFAAITNEIKARSLAETREHDRPVIIFFETRQKLDDYYKHLKEVDRSIPVGRLRLLTEELSLNSKNQVINLAGTQGTVTLAVGSFGRGTDFRCTDGRLDAKGGVHVINTQLQSQVEDTQTRGRTARQGNKGTYSLVLNGQDLEKFGITPDDINKMNEGSETQTRYDVLADKVNAFYQAQDSANIQAANELIEDHNKTRDILAKLARRESRDFEEIKNFLISHNRAPRVDVEKSRVLCLVDATGSMGGVLQEVKENLTEMLRRVKEVLDEHDCSTIVEFQLAFYRNYNSGAKVLEHSRWSDDAATLNKFLTGIRAEGGIDYEAIEIALYHANREVDKGRALGVETKVMLIGDNPANRKKDLSHHRWLYRGLYGSCGYDDAQDSDAELKALKEKNSAVNAFFIPSGSYSMPNHYRGSEENSRRGIYEIAQKTGGKAADLTTADSLVNAVTEQLLISAAGDDDDRAAQFIASCRQKFNTGGAAFFSDASASSSRAPVHGVSGRSLPG